MTMDDRMSWKPHSYSSVSPYLVVSGAQKVIDFAKAAFGATELRRYEMPDGSIMHAEIRIDDTVIMLGDGGATFPPFASLIHVYVADVDQVYERALKAGATVVEVPRTREGDPDKRGSVKDACGNTWAIATQLPKQGDDPR
jgi:PhnB protein